MTQLTPHFNLREFTFSETAARMGREVEPTQMQRANLQYLCERLLEPIRELLNKPVVITSGLRPQWLNDAVGGSPTSAHLTGLAADVRVVGQTPEQFCRWLQANAKAEDWPIDQCILEFGRWTHLAVAPRPKMQFLTAKKVNGRTVYLDDIHP